MHYSMPFCGINSVSYVFTLAWVNPCCLAAARFYFHIVFYSFSMIHGLALVYFKYPDDAQQMGLGC